MTREILKIGDITSTGHEVAQVLGQGPAGAIYISKNGEIRWHYYKNDGVLPDELGLVVARFDAILADIRDVAAPLSEKKPLYELAGKTLYLAFSARKLVDASTTFAEVERRIAIFSQRVSQKKAVTDKEPGVDLVIVCALHDPELQAVLTLSTPENPPIVSNDPQTYHATTWNTKKGQALRVILAAPNQMGLAAAGILATKMVLHFRPRLVAMAGIAAGVKDSAQGYGDIVAPEHTFDYGAGKSVDAGKSVALLPNPSPLPINAKLLGRLKEWQRTREALDSIPQGWQAAKPRTVLSLHTGPMFSSPTVLQTRKPITQALSQWRKLAAVEMEAYAVHRACTDAVDPAPLFICAKSVCDFAVGKGDEWQHYAAYTSARFVFEFITKEWERLFPR